MIRKRFTVGPGGLLYVVVTMLIYAAAQFTQANLLFWGFGLLIGGLVISVAMSWLTMRRIELQRVLPAHGVAGEAMMLRYQLINRKKWTPAFGLRISERWVDDRRRWWWWRRSRLPDSLNGRPYGWVLHLGANQTAQAEAPCWPTKRGHLHFHRVTVTTTFPFNVIGRVIEYDLPGRVLVYPHLWRIDRRVLHKLSAADPYGRKRLDRGGGHEEFYGLRQYRVGDSMKLIDWKRSARTGELVTRDLTQPSPPRLMVGLDLTGGPPADEKHVARNGGRRRRRSAARPQPDPIESAISLAASLVCDAYFHGYQIGLIVSGADAAAFPIHHSLPHRSRMLETLSLLNPAQPSPDAQTPAVPPTVIVRPAGHRGTMEVGRAVVFDTAHMDQYVSALQGGSEAVLSRTAAPRTRRQMMQLDESWN